MTNMKRHWVLAAAGVLIVVLILLSGIRENAVSNIYFIPAGTFGLFLGENISSETPGKTTAEIPRSVTIISVSQNPDTSIIRIAGWTTLPSGSEILFEIWPADIDVRKKNAGEVTGFSGKTSVFERNGSAAWSGEFDAGSWTRGGYIINAWPEQLDPRYGERVMFFIPLNDTIRNSAGTYSGNGEILLTSWSLSGTPGNPVSVTPLTTPV